MVAPEEEMVVSSKRQTARNRDHFLHRADGQDDVENQQMIHRHRQILVALGGKT